MQTAASAGRAATPSVDRHLPAFDVTSSFHRSADAPAEAARAALAHLRPFDRLLGGLVALGVADRIVSPRLLSDAAGVPAGGLGALDNDGDGASYGLVWRLDGGSAGAGAASDFASFDEPGHAKVVWTLSVREDGPTSSLLSCEVRVSGLDPVSSRRIRDAWSFLGPLVESQARRLLLTLKSAAEERAEESEEPVVVQVRPRLRVVV